jgi:hypothetical protein
MVWTDGKQVPYKLKHAITVKAKIFAAVVDLITH